MSYTKKPQRFNPQTANVLLSLSKCLNKKKLPVRGEDIVAYGTGEFEVLLDFYGARV